MYQVNENVLYGSQGVCRITEITTKEFQGTQTDYYILKPLENSASTIYVPVNNKTLTDKMRRVLSPEEIVQLIDSIPREPSAWIENDNDRKETYKNILSGGDRMALLKVIQALYLHQEALRQKGKRLHLADEHIFKAAEKILYDEFSLVLHITPEQVPPFIRNRIQHTETASALPSA